MDTGEKVRQGNGLVNELYKIINQVGNSDSSAEEAIKAVYALCNFYQHLEAFSARFGGSDPMVKGFEAMADKVAERLKHHPALAHV